MEKKDVPQILLDQYSPKTSFPYQDLETDMN